MKQQNDRGRFIDQIARSAVHFQVVGAILNLYGSNSMRRRQFETENLKCS